MKLLLNQKEALKEIKKLCKKIEESDEEKIVKISMLLALAQLEKKFLTDYFYET